MQVTQTGFAVLGALVFAIGLYGVVIRRDVLGIASGFAIAIIGTLVAVAGFAQSDHGGELPPEGDVVGFVIVVAVASVTLVAVSVGMALYRHIADV